jgi:DNA-binding beta-propeller fold protein YncE
MADIFNPNFSDGSIERLNVDTHVVDTIVSIGGGLRGIAIDQTNQKLYWTDVDSKTISRSNLDGTFIVPIVTTGLSWPMDIDVDPIANWIAWGDQTVGDVGHAHLDGSGAGALLSTPFGSGIVFDQAHGKIYWTTALPSGVDGEIRRCNLDGSGVTVIVTGLGKPASIALDVTGGKIYWTDYVNDVVRRANLDGSVPENLYVVGANLNPDGIALDLTAGKVYWAQEYAADRDKIMRMNLNGTNPEEVLVGNFGLISDLVFIGDVADVVGSSPGTGAALSSWPNPLTDHATIRLALPESGPVRLGLYAADGRRIAAILDGVLPAGNHDVDWTGRDEAGRAVPGGVYFYRAEIGGRSTTAKVTVTR